jgi:hypothetical protein
MTNKKLEFVIEGKIVDLAKIGKNHLKDALVKVSDDMTRSKSQLMLDSLRDIKNRLLSLN